MNGYAVPPVYLSQSSPRPIEHEHTTATSAGPLAEPELLAALLKEHRRVVSGYLGPMPVCVTCRQQWPCKTLMLVCSGCRLLWTHNWSPPKPVPTAREVAAWP